MKKEIDNPSYNEYVIWLKQTYDLCPDDKFNGLNAIEELKSLRDEHFGLLGETELVKIMKEEGTFEQHKKAWEKYNVLTFEEYIEAKK